MWCTASSTSTGTSSPLPLRRLPCSASYSRRGGLRALGCERSAGCSRSQPGPLPPRLCTRSSRRGWRHAASTTPLLPSTGATLRRRWMTPAARTISIPSRSTPCSPGGRPRPRAGTSPPPGGCTRRRSRSSRTTGGPGTTGLSCSRRSRGRRRRSSTPSRQPSAIRVGWPAPTPLRSLRRSSAEPGLRPEGAENAVDERLGDVCGDLPGPVGEEALTVVVKAGDVGEAGLFQQALEVSRRVAHLGDPILVACVAALEAVLPVRLDEQEATAGAERPSGRGDDEVGAAAVVQRVIEERGVKTMVEVERLHVGHF